MGSRGATLRPMTEDDARRVLLVQALEQQAAGAAAPDWSAQDRGWATRQAVAAVGERATPQAFVVARAGIALHKLLPRHPAAQRWLARRAWHPAWVVLALLLGLLAGLAVDQLGAPQRVNLLAPAVWAVVGWNLLVYLAWLLPLGRLGGHGWRSTLAGWIGPSQEPAGLLWAERAAPLSAQRAALVMHTASAALALGLVAGLYTRGLVLDYRAGWQSTFLDSVAVQAVLGWLLAPASALTGITVPDVAPLRVGPGADATASAAPWIHLLAATLALAVVLPRTLLALWAGWRARRLSQHFPLPLDTPYFEALHPLMRPGLPHTLRLLWVAPPGTPPLRLFGVEVASPVVPLTLLRSDEGDELQLHTLEAADTAAPATPAPAWRRWWDGLAAPDGTATRPDLALRQRTDAVLLLTAPGQPRPAHVAALVRPVVVLLDTPEAASGPSLESANPDAAQAQRPDDTPPDPLTLHLHARADGWLPEGRLLTALQAAMPDDPRLARLRSTWVAAQQARLDDSVAVLARSLARIAAHHEPVADEGLLARRAEADAARQALAGALESELRACDQALAQLHGPAFAVVLADAAPLPAAALRTGVGEGRAALVGGVVTGALAGLKADVLSGGLTMGAGLVAGGLLGALGAAGVARGLNVVRGTDHPYAAWNDEALAPIVHGVLQRYLVLAHGLPPARAQQQLAPALAAHQAALAALWKQRERRLHNTGEHERLAHTLSPLLLQVVKLALGGP